MKWLKRTPEVADSYEEFASHFCENCAGILPNLPGRSMVPVIDPNNLKPPKMANVSTFGLD